jgi:flagellar L-ring protein precursor FlgH
MKWCLIVILSFVFSGCVINRTAMPDDPEYAPVMVATPAQVAPQNGSLYRSASGLNLFSDRVARNVGDILTVILQESTSSQKSTSVDINKESGIDVPEVLGAAGTMLGNPIGFKGLSLGTDLSSQSEFKGGGDAAQSNNLSGSIAVSIVEVWPNGTLVIRGEKWLTLNKGNEFIRINGLVRPDDVSTNNTILSTKVANARITYSGTGQMASSQSMGWVTRFFNSKYWPL